MELHSTDSIQEAIGRGVISRTTIHQWQLSVVQKLVFDDQSIYAYKANLPPSVENDFYRRSNTDLLPEHIQLPQVASTQGLLLKWIHFPAISDLTLEQIDLCSLCELVVDRLGSMSGSLPFHTDISSRVRWEDYISRMLARFETYFLRNQNGSVPRSATRYISSFADNKKILEILCKSTRLIHGDLKSDQIFVSSGNIKVIDWQRPVVGPASLDLASLLISLGIDPSGKVSPEILQVHWILFTGWILEAWMDHFDQTTGTMERWLLLGLSKLKQAAL